MSDCKFHTTEINSNYASLVHVKMLNSEPIDGFIDFCKNLGDDCNVLYKQRSMKNGPTYEALILCKGANIYVKTEHVHEVTIVRLVGEYNEILKLIPPILDLCTKRNIIRLNPTLRTSMDYKLLDILLDDGPQLPPPHHDVLHALPTRDDDLAALEAQEHHRRVVRPVDQAREHLRLVGAEAAMLLVHPQDVQRLARVQRHHGIANHVLDRDVLHHEVHIVHVLLQHLHHVQAGMDALVPALRARQHQLPGAEEQDRAGRVVDPYRDRGELVPVVEGVGQHHANVLEVYRHDAGPDLRRRDDVVDKGRGDVIIVTIQLVAVLKLVDLLDGKRGVMALLHPSTGRPAVDSTLWD
eukprot:757588-Hanusia_phi.AAC.10